MNIATATQAILPPLVALCSRNRLKVLVVAVFLAAASLWATRTYLGVTTDTGGMFAASLPWKQRTDALAHLFPQNDGPDRCRGQRPHSRGSGSDRSRPGR